jgi:class 3 adenylate cyclase/tetratricopeptide (TPR) repeat protein
MQTVVAAGTHRLAAVMFTDLVGYTARAQRDEPQALRFLDEQRRLMRPKFEEHHGREVKTIGDAFLVEFDSALNATGCAVAIQRALYERNLREPGESIDVRIGIHLGEVSHDNGDIHGDAVNVASRVYPLADPGGICLSEPVYAQIRGRLELAVEKLPPTPLKNVAYPVDLYRAVLPWSERGLSALLPWTDRETEMETVQHAFTAALGGEANAVMLVGEVGIGKTRLGDEVLERARKSGVRVLRGRCAPGELGAPYAPWIEAFRHLVRDAPPALLFRALGPQPREVARLVPEVLDKVGPLPPATAAEPEQARLQFLEGIGQFLDRLSSEGPVVVFLDDLQWADPASTLLLRFLLPRLKKRPVLLLGAYRKDEGDENRALREALTDLHREHLLTTVPLGRFDPVQVGTLIGEMFHTREVSQEFRELVHTRTGGNPLLVEEVLRALVRDKVIYWSGSGWERRPVTEIEIPEGVKEIITQRLRRFDEQAVDVLRLASVLGYEFDFDLLAEVSGVEEGKLLDLLEGLLRGRILQEAKGPHGRALYVFADHPTRDVLYAEVSLVRRRRLHLKIAQALERQGEKGTRERLGELAHHYVEGNDVAKAREYTVKAAEQAAAIFAHDEAFRLYRTALELGEEDTDDAARAALLERLAIEASHLARGGDAMKFLLEAGGLYARSNRIREQAHVLSEASRIAREQIGDALRAVELSRQAVTILERLGESPQLAESLVGLGVVLSATGQQEEARAVLERAEPLTEKFALADGRSVVLQFLANIAPWEEKEKAIAMARQGAEIAAEAGAVRTATKYANLSFALAGIAGDFAGALEVTERARQEAERRGQPNYVRFARLARAHVFLQLGRLQEARTEALESREGGPEAGRSLNEAMATSALAIVEALRGDRAAARRYADEARAAWQGIHAPVAGTQTAIAIWQRAHDDGEEDPTTEAWLEELLVEAQSRGHAMQTARAHAELLVALADIRARRGDVQGAAALESDLKVMAAAFHEAWTDAFLARLRGSVADARGETEEAVRRWAEAVALLERARMTAQPLGRALGRLAAAQARAGDANAARATYDRAIAILDRIGATPPAEALRAARARLPP